MLSLLTEDVMLVSDGGGKAIATTYPIQSRDRVARILAAAFEGIKYYYQGSPHFEVAPLNGETGIVLRSGDEIVAAIFIQLRRGKLARIYAVQNPDKLDWV